MTTTDELAADTLWSLGAIAITERADAIDAGFVDADAERSAWAVVSARWPAEIVADDTSTRLDGWRAHARPVRVGNVVVEPAWLPPSTAAPDDVVVRIEPGRAFGIGSHATTRLALAAVLARVRAGDAVLDVGTGTGVLAIASVLVGAARAGAIDVDAEAREVATANVAANGCVGRVEVSGTDLASVIDRYDVVVANLGGLLLPVALADDLARVTRRVLVVSGLLDPDVTGPRPDPLDSALGATGLRLVDVDAADGWMARTYAR